MEAVLHLDVDPVTGERWPTWIRPSVLLFIALEGSVCAVDLTL